MVSSVVVVEVVARVDVLVGVKVDNVGVVGVAVTIWQRGYIGYEGYGSLAPSQNTLCHAHFPAEFHISAHLSLSL